VQQVRRDGFDPGYRQRVEEFNLRHEDAYKTHNGKLLVGRDQSQRK